MPNLIPPLFAIHDTTVPEFAQTLPGITSYKCRSVSMRSMQLLKLRRHNAVSQKETVDAEETVMIQSRP